MFNWIIPNKANVHMWFKWDEFKSAPVYNINRRAAKYRLAFGSKRERMTRKAVSMVRRAECAKYAHVYFNF